MRAPSALLLAMESRAFLEWTACIATWPLLGCAAKGDGHPVLVLPGLTAGDASTWPLRRFLEGLGYAAYPWELGLNCGPRDGVVRKLLARIRSIHREHGRKVSLVGWSLGGAMARALAVREPLRVRSVTTLGSPLGGHPKASNAWRLFELVSGVRADDPRLRALMRRHPPVPTTSILSKTDGIVSWPMSVIPQNEKSENIEVSASHFGMGANPAVLWAIADRLSQPEDNWRPFDRSGWRALVYGDPQGADNARLLAT
ncbi:MAG: alpha/beta fold hydrolase [Rudaea sp.]|nr:alpha/beta fold hydrolase [Rudaea sp.]